MGPIIVHNQAVELSWIWLSEQAFHTGDCHGFSGSLGKRLNQPVFDPFPGGKNPSGNFGRYSWAFEFVYYS